MNYGRQGIKQKKKLLNSATTKLGTKLGIFFIKLALVAAIAVVVSGSCLVLGSFQGIIENAPDIASVNVSPEGFATKIYDSDENEIQTLSSAGANRTYVTIDQIPKDLQHAFIAIEDKRFYEHKGIDIKRTTYATIMYIINRGDSESGGGSTITQQLIKNIKNDKADSGSKGIERKIREMARAYNVEKILSKDQILEFYLNQIPMGSTIYGVGMAAEYYFNKPVGELDIAECAFLAGINHGPSAYNPFIGLDNTEKIKNRTKEVLFQMKEQGYIKNEEEYNKAVEEVENGLTFEQGANVSKATYSYHTAAAVKQVIEDLMEAKDINREAAEFMVENNGYTIYTTQDTAIQNVMEEEFLKDKYIKDESLCKFPLQVFVF